MARDAEAASADVIPFPGTGVRGQPGATGAHGMGERVWDVEAFPLMIDIRERGSERPVALLVTAGGFILNGDIKGRLAGGAASVAAALDRAVADAARSVGVWPEMVVVGIRFGLVSCCHGSSGQTDCRENSSGIFEVGSDV